MSDQIKVGDLVMVVRGHECFVNERLGWTFTVAALFPQSGGGWTCQRCRTRDIAQSDLYGASSTGIPGKAVPLSWLKRIPPIEELERQQDKATKPHKSDLVEAMAQLAQDCKRILNG